MIEQTPVFRGLFLLGCVFVMPAPVRAQVPQKEYPQAYHEPFKGKPKKAEDFALIGGDAVNCVKFEQKGLRITLPAGRGRGPVGVGTTFGVAGDFEITLRYELLEEPAPADAATANIGTRFSLTVDLNKQGLHEASIRRKVTPKQPAHILAYRSLRKDADSKPDNLGQVFPVKEKTGRFRLVRTGADLAYYLADGLDKEFTLLTTHPFGADDLKDVQILGQTTSPKAALDVRFTDLSIRAAAVPKTLEPLPLPPAPPPRDLPERVEFPFHEGVDRQPLLRLFGAGARGMMTVNEQGLRFTVPGERKSNNPVGVESALRLRGDFEITFGYEVLAVPDPPPPLGAGVDLWVKFDTPDAARALMSRIQRPAGPGFGANYATTGPNGKEAFRGLSYQGAKEPRGQLRLIRTGKKLIYQIADGAGGFQVLATKEFATADVVGVRAQATTGWQAKTGVDVRLINLQLRAEKTLKPVPKEFAERVDMQLREGIEKYLWLRFDGPDAAAMARTDAQGLRFTVPAERTDYHDIGLESQRRLRGDFEVTLHYELLALPDPPPKLGAGTVLQIQLDTPDQFKARLGHNRSARGFLCGANYITIGNDGKEVFKGITVQPVNEKEKQAALRLARTGKKLTYLIAEGKAGFQTIATKDVGTADVLSVRALCATGWAGGFGVDIRLSSLDLRADQMPGSAAPPPAIVADVPENPGAAVPEAPSSIWLAAIVSGGLALAVLLALAARLWLRPRRPGAEMSGKGQKATTADGQPPLAFSCPECGKKMQVKATLAGKRVKCPKCGQTVPVVI